jgi:hypothetical protein
MFPTTDSYHKWNWQISKWNQYIIMACPTQENLNSTPKSVRNYGRVKNWEVLFLNFPYVLDGLLYF